MEAGRAGAVELLVAALVGDVERARVLLPPCGNPEEDGSGDRLSSEPIAQVVERGVQRVEVVTIEGQHQLDGTVGAEVGE